MRPNGSQATRAAPYFTTIARITASIQSPMMSMS